MASEKIKILEGKSISLYRKRDSRVIYRKKIDVLHDIIQAHYDASPTMSMQSGKQALDLTMKIADYKRISSNYKIIGNADIGNTLLRGDKK